jgi:hypothetical protein
MDPDIISFAVVSAVLVTGVVILAPLLVWVVRALAKKPTHRELSNPLQFEQRFDQLQQSVDAIAVEVERIAEAQRFSAKLLAERSETQSLPH